VILLCRPNRIALSNALRRRQIISDVKSSSALRANCLRSGRIVTSAATGAFKISNMGHPVISYISSRLIARFSMSGITSTNKVDPANREMLRPDYSVECRHRVRPSCSESNYASCSFGFAPSARS
jgi:hypothetical protein